MAKIRKGDLVEIISGPKMKNDKQFRGAQGIVLEAVSYTHLTLPTNREV